MTHKPTVGIIGAGYVFSTTALLPVNRAYKAALRTL